MNKKRKETGTNYLFILAEFFTSTSIICVLIPYAFPLWWNYSDFYIVLNLIFWFGLVSPFLGFFPAIFSSPEGDWRAGFMMIINFICLFFFLLGPVIWSSVINL